MKTIITRFPPSPTGFLHIGGARTAIFNWLWARHTNGKFILRIEDTDVKRSTQESVDGILDGLNWLGLNWDEGPYFQSDRVDIYKTHLSQLLESGHAYYCTCSQDEVTQMREKAKAAGLKPKYNGKCREKNLGKSEDAVVRFKAPLDGVTIINDTIKGNISIQNKELDDFVIQRSDGTFTYNFVVVVDDISMNVNTIIRGDDHVNNTPRQIQLYQALGCELPEFGHVPMVLGQDRSRLSKRHGAMSVTAYRDMGYLPEAVINYLVRLGWSHGDQEFFTIDDLIEKFDIKNIGKSAGVFNPEKLLALNADHIKGAAVKHTATHLIPYLKDKGIEQFDENYLHQIIPTLNTRSKTLLEMADGAEFYFKDQVEFDEKAAKKFLKPNILEPLELLVAQLSNIDEFTQENLENAFKNVMDQTGLKLGKIAQPVRIALTGKTVSPGIFEIIDVLGKSKTIDRLEKTVAFIKTGTSSKIENPA